MIQSCQSVADKHNNAWRNKQGNWMGWLYRYSIRRPWLVIVTATVISLAVMPGALRLKIRTDKHALVPPNAPEIRIEMA